MSAHATNPNATRPPRFSQELRELADRFANQKVRLRELLDATKGRGFNLLLVLIALPFLTPIPLPGFSIPFGLIVAIIGARLALGQKPWLPQRLLDRELPPGFLTKLVNAASRVLKLLEYFLRPRLLFLHNHIIYRHLAGALIMISGIYLVLPLPIPFSNGLPGWTVLLLSAAALERDGLSFLAGCVMFLVSTAFFALLAFGGVEVLGQFRQWITGQ